MSGSIFDALGNLGTNPGLMALTGAAGGFAQAAMPQPYRGGTPFGAALGMAAQGLGAGAGNAYKNQLEQAQAQGAQLTNLGTASALPLTLARNKMLADIYSNPALVQQLMGAGSTGPGGTGGAATPAATAPSGVLPSALSSIQDPATRTLAINAAMKAGLPQEAWPTWIAGVHNESGWNLQAPDNHNTNGTVDIGPGQVNSATGPSLGYTVDQLRDPLTNLTASAQYFGQKWKQAQGKASGALAGYNTGSVTGDAPAYVARGMLRLGQWGYPTPQGTATPTSDSAATPAAAPTTGSVDANSALAMAQQYEQQANRIEFATRLGLPAAGDPAALRTAAQQYRALALAGPTAGAEAGAKAAVDLASAGPIQRAKTLNTNIDLRQGGMTLLPDGNGGFSAVKNPNLEKGVDPDTGQEVFGHVTPPSPFAPPGTPGQFVPVTGAGGKPLVAAIAPQQQEGRTEAVKDFLTKDQDSYQAAQNTQGWLNQIDHAADAMNKAGPAYMTGPFAGERLATMSTVNDMARTLGVKAPFDQSAVASWEEMKKATTTAGFELSSHYEGHARQAAATIMNATSAVPAATNSPLGLKLVSSGIREGAQSAMDAHEYKQMIYNQTQGAGLENAETDFYKAHPAQQYANRAISNVSPFVVKGPQDFNRFLPGTFITDGKTIDPATGKPKIVQVPERTDTIGGLQFPLKMPTYVQQGTPNAP